MRTPQGQGGGKRQPYLLLNQQRAAILLGFGEYLWKRWRYHSGVKSFNLWIAAAVSTHSVRGGEVVTVDHKICILKGKVSEKKARVNILMLNSQVSCPSIPDNRLSSEQGFILAHGAPVGKPTALLRGALQLCMTAHLGNLPFGNPSPKVGASPKAKHTVLTWGWSWELNTQHYFSGSDWEVEMAYSAVHELLWGLWDVFFKGSFCLIFVCLCVCFKSSLPN